MDSLVASCIVLGLVFIDVVQSLYFSFDTKKSSDGSETIEQVIRTHELTALQSPLRSPDPGFILCAVVCK